MRVIAAFQYEKWEWFSFNWNFESYIVLNSLDKWIFKQFSRYQLTRSCQTVKCMQKKKKGIRTVFIVSVCLDFNVFHFIGVGMRAAISCACWSKMWNVNDLWRTHTGKFAQTTFEHNNNWTKHPELKSRDATKSFQRFVAYIIFMAYMLWNSYGKLQKINSQIKKKKSKWKRKKILNYWNVWIWINSPLIDY